jgi:Na+/phosphate symporter
VKQLRYSPTPRSTVDRLTEAIKLYIAKLTRGSLDEREGRLAASATLKAM